MKAEIIPTGDNSFTIYLPDLDETYHSRKGAIAESLHVYIETGFREVAKNRQDIRIFEFGFGTGLNAVLTWLEAEKDHKKVFYDTVEKHPLPEEVFSRLNYGTFLQSERKLDQLHRIPWNEQYILSEYFIFQKHHLDIESFAFPADFYDLVYYDAFAPSKQAEVWNEELISKIYRSMAPDGILVTYCSQGGFRRNLISAGFEVEKIPGPLGKREMIRAKK